MDRPGRTRFTGAPAPQITEWATAHGDLHFANLTADGPVILDWEGWGIAPYGYDAALLYVYSLLVPATAARIKQEFADVLDSPRAELPR
ncbi:phosphotransferase [Streptomyces sp. NPDC018019]|uniref:phosphotransferase n=1 Tax=Streptomyces sp. NPDC018019 TaxID=3365030 RepID=UPI0037BABFF3